MFWLFTYMIRNIFWNSGVQRRVRGATSLRHLVPDVYMSRELVVDFSLKSYIHAKLFIAQRNVVNN